MMPNNVRPMVEPDQAAMRRHLEVLFAPMRAVSDELQVEIAWTDGAHQIRHATLFFITPTGLDMAAAHAVRKNRQGLNVYVGVNPRKRTAVQGRRANAADVETSAWQFAEIDAASGIDAIERCALAPTFVVLTGTVPHERVHAYWRRDHMTSDFAVWSEHQERIAGALSGDVMSNPDRVLRLAGSVNYPSQKKLQRGYKVELTALRDGAGTVASDAEIARTFPPVSTVRSLPSDPSSGDPVAYRDRLRLIPIDTVSELLQRARGGDQWHNCMIRVVGAWVERGWTDVEIIATAGYVTLPGYDVGQTEADLRVMIDGARRKWGRQPDADVVEPQEEETDAVVSDVMDGDTLPVLNMDALAAKTSPPWLVRDIIVARSVAVAYGAPGSFKSFVALSMALSIAHGQKWMGRRVMQGAVVYVAGEGAAGLKARVAAWKQHHGIHANEAPFYVIEHAVNLIEDAQTDRLIRSIRRCVNAPVAMVIIDTVARAMAGADENSATDMGRMIAAMDRVKVEVGAAVLGIHHSGKDKDRGARGSNALLGGVDAMMRVDRDPGSQRLTLTVEKQKDAEEAEPLSMGMIRVDTDTTIDALRVIEAASLVPVPDDGAPVAGATPTDAVTAVVDVIRAAGGRALSMNAIVLEIVSRGLIPGGKSMVRQVIEAAIPMTPASADVVVNGSELRLYRARNGIGSTAPVQVFIGEQKA